jgi:hypothetical protein
MNKNEFIRNIFGTLAVMFGLFGVCCVVWGFFWMVLSSFVSLIFSILMYQKYDSKLNGGKK